MTDNLYQCPIREWNSFDEAGKIRFNNVMSKSLEFQPDLIHPMALPQPDTDWQYTCFSFACIAGWNDFHRDYNPKKEEPIFTLEDKLKRLRDIAGSNN